MRKLILILIFAIAAWQGYTKYAAYRAGTAAEARGAEASGVAPGRTLPDAPASRSFQCDGRIYCSQMTSCQEATYFLRNCPGVKMDGDGDGVPCERQWCN